jgi:electron transport complex protein RnfB
VAAVSAAPVPRRPGFAPAPVTVTDRCAGCGACLLTCPVHAIRPVGGALLVRADLCDGCGECVEICPVDAIEETEEGNP